MTLDEMIKDFKTEENKKDDYCDCDHTPCCPHCGKKVRSWPERFEPRPYSPPYGEPYRPYPPVVTWYTLA